MPDEVKPTPAEELGAPRRVARDLGAGWNARAIPVQVKGEVVGWRGGLFAGGERRHTCNTVREQPSDAEDDAAAVRKNQLRRGVKVRPPAPDPEPEARAAEPK